MNDVVPLAALEAVAIERNTMTGDHRCKLCDAIWSASAAPWHKRQCLLRTALGPRERTEGIDAALGQLAIDVQQLSRRVMAIESTLGCVGVEVRTWDERATPR